jgi:exodeoxyribonuclease VII small subunit
MSSTKKKNTGGFEENYKLLEELSQELQENKVGVDQLVPRMKEALEAIKVCKSVLKETSSQLVEINKEFEDLEELASED